MNEDVVQINSNNRSELDTLITNILENALPCSLTTACTTIDLVIQLVFLLVHFLSENHRRVIDVRREGW